MPRDPLIGLVGKPSSGKSTTLNSLTDASSKVGNFPFTTIDPQRAVGYLQVPCACSRFIGTSTRCRPNYGSCVDGRRSVPIELLDVAGLVPGAHLGRGLGNKFLDDLRHADALIHVVDVSGTTDADGKATRGYDPSKDVEWLTAEIEKWIEGNLQKNWGGIKRRHVATKASAAETLQNQMSGYGSTPKTVVATLDALAAAAAAAAAGAAGAGAGGGGSKGGGGSASGASTSASAPPTTSALGPLESWDEAAVATFVSAFVRTRFPTVLALNKIDHADADANITRIARAHPPESIVLTSAISEVFLRKLAKQKFVRYVEGGEFVDTREDLVEQGEPDGGGLLPLDDKLRTRIENLKDLVLYRFGATGVVQALSRAADLLGLVPVFPVKNVHGLRLPGKGAGAAADGSSGGEGETGPPGKEPIFRDCVLVKKGSTVRDVARKVVGDAPLAYVEGPGGVRVSEDDVVTVGRCDVLSFRIGR